MSQSVSELAFVSLMLIPLSFVSFEDSRKQPFVLGNGGSILPAPQLTLHTTGTRPSKDVPTHFESSVRRFTRLAVILAVHYGNCGEGRSIWTENDPVVGLATFGVVIPRTKEKYGGVTRRLHDRGCRP